MSRDFKIVIPGESMRTNVTGCQQSKARMLAKPPSHSEWPMIKNYQAQSVHIADAEDLNSKNHVAVAMCRAGEEVV